MDLNEIRKLIELMDANKLVEFEYEEEGRKIRLRRWEDRHAVAPSAGAASAPAAPVPVLSPPVAGGATADVPPPTRSADLVDFKSPLVGTFYRAPKPDAEPFVNVGDEVSAEKVLCIIEAMKVMNEIKAEMNGVVREILVKNGQAVEYGEPLFLIEKR
ncbi:MAG: acetyl-CoA carboxylase biotin carboxyl carrier protein [Planctomycetes bacterium]|nr:acetyl-CoA carboxylase biotin carboxyl carrier protein [Planctomycetota bacterium]